MRHAQAVCLLLVLPLTWGCGATEEDPVVQEERNHVHEVMALAKVTFGPCLEILRGKAEILEREEDSDGAVVGAQMVRYEEVVTRPKLEFAQQALNRAESTFGEMELDRSEVRDYARRFLNAHKRLCKTAERPARDLWSLERAVTQDVARIYGLQDYLPLELRLTTAQEERALDPHRQALGTALVQARRAKTHRSKAEEWRRTPQEKEQTMTREEYRRAQAEWKAAQEEMERQRTRRAQQRAQYHRTLEEQRERATRRRDDGPLVGVGAAPPPAAPEEPRKADPRLEQFRSWQKGFQQTLAPLPTAVKRYRMVQADSLRSGPACENLAQKVATAQADASLYRLPVPETGLEEHLRKMLASFRAAADACELNDVAQANQHLQDAGAALSSIQRRIADVERRLLR